MIETRCMEKIPVVPFVLHKPRLCIALCLFIMLLVCTGLLRFDIAPMNNFLISNSKAERNAKLINEVFSNIDDLTVHQATKLNYGLEVIITNKSSESGSVFSLTAHDEIIRLDKFIQSLNAGVESNAIFYSNVCISSGNSCLIDGNYILSKEFRTGLSKGLMYSSNGIYITKSMEKGYGPYMFGNDMKIKGSNIFHINALRLRYNLKNSKLYKHLSEKWERKVIQSLLDWNSDVIKISFGGLSSFEDESKYYAKANFAVFTGTMGSYLIITVLLISVTIARKFYGLLIVFVAVIFNLIVAAATIGAISLSGYKFTVIGLLSAIFLIVLGNIRISRCLAEAESERLSKNSIIESSIAIFLKTIYSTIGPTIIMISTCIIIGITSSLSDVKCACIIIGTGVAVLFIVSIFLYLPLISFYIKLLRIKYNDLSDRLIYRLCSKYSQIIESYNFFAFALVVTTLLFGVFVYQLGRYRISFQRSWLFPKSSYFHEFLKYSEEKFTVGPPIMFFINQSITDLTSVRNDFSDLINICKKLPSTSNSFQLQWISFADDISHVETNKAFMSNDVLVVHNGTELVVKYSRIYCSYRKFEATIDEIATMHELYKLCKSSNLNVFPFSLSFYLLESIEEAHSTAFSFSFVCAEIFAIVYLIQFRNFKLILCPVVSVILCFIFFWGFLFSFDMKVDFINVSIFICALFVCVEIIANLNTCYEKQETRTSFSKLIFTTTLPVLISTLGSITVPLLLSCFQSYPLRLLSLGILITVFISIFFSAIFVSIVFCLTKRTERKQRF